MTALMFGCIHEKPSSINKMKKAKSNVSTEDSVAIDKNKFQEESWSHLEEKEKSQVNIDYLDAEVKLVKVDADINRTLEAFRALKSSVTTKYSLPSVISVTLPTKGSRNIVFYYSTFNKEFLGRTFLEE
jgi:hypothetical protein